MRASALALLLCAAPASAYVLEQSHWDPAQMPIHFEVNPSAAGVPGASASARCAETRT